MLKRQANLSTKVVLITAIPFLLFATLAGMQVQETVSRLNSLRSLKKNVDLLGAVSNAMHELQNERALASQFANDTITTKQLMEKRDAVDQKLAALQAPLSEGSLAQQDKNNLKTQLAEINDLRQRVSGKKITARECVTGYTNLLGSLLQFETLLARSTDVAELRDTMTSFTILESAKESGGRLRANLAQVISSDQPLTEEILQALIELKGGLETGLRSPALDESQSIQKRIAGFFASAPWSKVQSSFSAVVWLSSEGKYGQDTHVFSATMGDAMDELNQILFQEQTNLLSGIETLNKRLSIHLSGLTAMMVFLTLAQILGVGRVIRAVTTPINKAISHLNQTATMVAAKSHALKDHSAKVTSASTEAASALQQTMTSLHQISKMISRNAQNSGHARELANKGMGVADQGRKAIEKMMATIDDISKANLAFMKQIEETNRQVSNIVVVISEIGNKTKVINEIVFQTKLLSFNAAVEAARAGEHGKGFAVVADEISNLAQMSGKAAEEIRILLNSSTEEAAQIVETTNSRVQSSIADTKARIDTGLSASRHCDEVLRTILANVAEVNTLVAEISQACQEQELGVREISGAMNQMDQATHQNSASSTQSLSAAEALTMEATNLRNVVVALTHTVSGRSTASDAQEVEGPARYLQLMNNFKQNKDEDGSSFDKAS